MADARLERGELLERRLARRVIHPLAAADPLAIGVLEVADQLFHLRFGRGREMRLHVDLADALAERAVDRCDSALPPLALLLNARQLLRIESEARVVERLGKHVRVIRDEAEGDPFLPGRQWGRTKDLAGTGNRRRFGHDDRLRIAEAAFGEHRVPVELRRQLGQLGAGHRIVDLVDVSAVGGLPLDLRQSGLERDDAVGCALGIGLAGELFDRYDIVPIGSAMRLHLRIVFEIIFAARHAERRLAGEHRIHVGVLEIGPDAYVDRTCVARLDEQREELGAGLRAVDLGQVRLQRGSAGRFDRVGVHEAGVEVADLLPKTIAVQIIAELLDDVADVLLRLVGKRDERTGRRPVGGNLGAVVPSPVDVGPEIVARLDRAVHRGLVIAPVAVNRLGCIRGKRHGNSEKARGSERQHLETHGFSPLRWIGGQMP